MLVRKILFAAVAAASLALSAGAFAQSGQGGYLGLNPGGQLAAAPSAVPHPGSGQGGYLGVNPGAGLSAPKPADAAEMMVNPAAWCRTGSVEPDRCASRAMPDHQYCMAKGADHYATCRRMMDFIGWHN